MPGDEHADGEADAHDVGAALARSHGDHAVSLDRGDDPVTLVDYAERPRLGDWSLRSALVRFAQPDPTRVSAVLELIRRTDGALHPVRRALEKHLFAVDDLGSVQIRSGDLAFVLRDNEASADAALAGYESVIALDDDEIESLPLLGVAAILDELGDLMATWAERVGDVDPAEAIDRLGRAAHTELESLGVPRETAPEGYRGRRG